MSEFFEKVAAENEDLADVIIKVADEEVVSQLNEEEQLDAFLDALEAEGVDLNDPKVLEELKTASADDIYTYNLANVTEIISEDICKVAAGEPGFETAAAAKAVEQFFDINGAATFGSSFGPGNNSFGTTISPVVDKNVFGGFGKQIMTTNIQPNAVNASGKISGLLNGSNMNIIKAASDEDIMEYFFTKLAEAAELEGQTVDEFVHDLGIEALKDEVKVASTENEGKVAAFVKGAAAKEKKSIFKKKKEEESEEKEASDVVFEYVEKVASENNVDPEDLVLEYGLQKAAEYLDELHAEMEKEAGDKWDKFKNFVKDTGVKSKDAVVSTAKKSVFTNKGRVLLGTAVGAAAGAGYAAAKGGEKGESTSDKLKRYGKSVGIGAASGATAGQGVNTVMGALARRKASAESVAGMDRNPWTGKKEKGFSFMTSLKNELVGQKDTIKDKAISAKDKVKRMFKKQEKNSSDETFENTLYQLAQEKLYNNAQ